MQVPVRPVENPNREWTLMHANEECRDVDPGRDSQLLWSVIAPKIRVHSRPFAVSPV